MPFKCEYKKYTIIKISDLIFDEKVADMFEKYSNHTFPKKYINNLYFVDSFKLDKHRLDSVIKGYYTGLPPISVEQVNDKYILLNGRHRVTATILKNEDTIPCEIIN